MTLAANTELLNRKVHDDIVSMREILSRLPDRGKYAPADFWETLSNKHVRLIEELGIQNFKRTINFEYNQWGVHSFRDRKIRNLLSRLIRRFRIPFGLASIRLHADDWSNVRWPDVIAQDTGESIQDQSSSPVRWRQRAYALYVGLLWMYVKLEDHLGILESLEEPPFGAPLPITQHGRTISQDLAMSTLEINHIARFADLSTIHRVAEVGAGYGRLPYVTLRHRPNLEYHIFDIPPALAVCQHYLAEVLGAGRVAPRWHNAEASPVPGAINLYLPHQLELLPDGYFDLVINVSSFDEMSAEQVDYYFAQIERTLRGWLYVKGHAENRGGTRRGVAHFPYRPHWKLLFRAPDPFVSTFEERIYRL